MQLDCWDKSSPKILLICLVKLKTLKNAIQCFQSVFALSHQISILSAVTKAASDCCKPLKTSERDIEEVTASLVGANEISVDAAWEVYGNFCI